MDRTLPILYSFRRCPYAMRARLALQESRIAVEHREVDLKARPEALRAVSPKATVPVLVLADGTVLEESLDIMRWALEQDDPSSWLPGTDSEQIRHQEFLAQNDGPFKHHLDRYKYATRYEDVDAEEHRTAAAGILHGLDAVLQNSPFLLGERRTMADIALAPFVRQFALADRTWFDLQPWPHLRAWLDSFLASERFQGIMRKHAVWSPT